MHQRSTWRLLHRCRLPKSSPTPPPPPPLALHTPPHDSHLGGGRGGRGRRGRGEGRGRGEEEGGEEGKRGGEKRRREREGGKEGEIAGVYGDSHPTRQLGTAGTVYLCCRRSSATPTQQIIRLPTDIVTSTAAMTQNEPPALTWCMAYNAPHRSRDLFATRTHHSSFPCDFPVAFPS